jgi:2',3'-cyclic-nucleotide 2'-phosphodiesterase (5'-nucleotidase family)
MTTTPRSVSALLLAAALAACVPPAAAPVPETQKRVRILHTNDFHGRLQEQRPTWSEGRGVGGSAVLAAHFDSARASFDGPTLVLSGGDDYQGTAISNVSWGAATIAVHNAKRYDAAALGNHEFDWGLDTLQARVGESRFPWLAANIFEAGTDRHPPWARPWVMLERQGVRVAVVGAALSTTPRIVMAGRVAGLDFRPEAPAIDRATRDARAQGADFVVVTMHVGASCESPRAPALDPTEESVGCTGEMMEIADALTERVDLIVGGHTHARVLAWGGDSIPLAEAASYSTHYSLTDLALVDGRARPTRREVRVAWADEVTADTMVARVVEEWETRVRPLTERVVVSLAEPMNREGEEYALGNLIADAVRSEAGAHASIVNNGSVRRGLPAGPVSWGVLYELQPFQNQLVTVEIDGARLRSALEHAVSGTRPDAHVSGMTVRWDPDAPSGSRIREIRLTDGRVIEPEDRVTLGLTEFMATGGDGYTMLAEVPLTRTALVDLDAVIQHLQSLPQPVAPPEVGRWRR